ncbi:hypothetical protein [Mycobacterium syngnathidarum]|uniref:hypothetical protein n=1 Tax=Mycobacterium syngnathidarum TaxID=1908205 RepID=UPI0013F4BEB2|nr:hypothetical protein [Mycobacterium syngnathidarum]
MHPNVDQLDRDQLDDLGLIPDTDHTEDLRKSVPVDPVLPAPAGTDPNTTNR